MLTEVMISGSREYSTRAQLQRRNSSLWIFKCDNTQSTKMNILTLKPAPVFLFENRLIFLRANSAYDLMIQQLYFIFIHFT